MKFNANLIADAIVNAAKAEGAFVRALVEQREAAGKTFKSGPAIDALTEALARSVDAGDIDVGSVKVYLSDARTMLECSMVVLIAACEDGHGRNGVVRRIRAVAGTKGKGGRPAGKGAGKTTKPADDAQAPAPAVENADRSWKQFLETIKAQAPGRKDWQSDDIVAFQDCASKMIALISRNAK
jgi:hypothetical protein